MEWLHRIFQRSPEIALFLSLAIGYWVGQIRFGKFQFGGVGGTLLAAIVISQVGVTVDNGVKSVMFAVFIYAVGYQSGPGFVSSLNRKSLREIAMSAFMAFAGLITVLVCAKLFHLNKGLAAGLAAGGMTQSAIIGTAGDAIAHLGLSADQVKSMQADVAVGYAVTYVFGTLGAIIVCVNILPRILGQGLKEASIEAEQAMSGSAEPAMGPGMVSALPELFGRVFRVDSGAGKTIKQIELAEHDMVVIEKVSRAGEPVEPAPEFVLSRDDIVLVVGHRKQMVEVGARLGPEVPDSGGLSLVMRTRRAVFTAEGMNHTTIAELRKSVERQLRHGVYIESITRAGQSVPVLPETRVEHGDVMTFYGTAADTKRAALAAGYEMEYTYKTDLIYMGVGLALGLLIGLIVIHISGIPLTLGSGGGCLVSGLLFGWMRGKYPMYGVMPAAASQLLRDFGLTAFVAVVGLNAGLQAEVTIRQSGVTLFLLGVVVTIVPLLLTLLFGRYVLRYDNAAMLAGALAGSRSSNPAFGGVLDKAESSVPTVPFAITYTIANVLLTLLGPLVVGLA
ncbi:aspartate-alanine antiporter [Paraburkholderia dinghuensis]|uniref:Aspartate-alanine antiporter n=1 Tax=Paraburkholderia dinghuensis TaxID=2305225 RepID=A0A3N6PWB6_9BURK|nr:aspartate-alanine antiporter [Paraburkholderia dinghuensis]RQH04166.1 aspartate-alanine antiporter [Paraburkholderia dinghuensis]